MPPPKNQKQLTELFARLGAPNPESWANSQVQEGINQLHRFLFLRQAWNLVIPDDEHSWMERAMVAARKNPDAPFAGVGDALSRLLEAGASRDDLADLVRGMQAQLLFDFCYLLDDPSLTEPELADIGWTLVETGSAFQPTEKTIGGLHESVLEVDPTGREMRPRAPR
jgi:hypothetical protein